MNTMTNHRPRLRPGDRRGSAMVLAILVILVLTIVGLAVAYMSQTEDRISGNARLTKAGLYAADTGLRSGEERLAAASKAGITIQSLMTLYPGDTVLNLPNGKVAVPLRISTVAFSNLVLPRLTMAAGTPDAKEVARYSLYVRNNDEDPGGPSNNTDSLLNLISVGQIVIPGTGGAADVVLSTKILEEQLLLTAGGNEFGAQKGANQGGTGSVVKGS